MKKKEPYKKLGDLPPHIFRNKLLTEAIGDEFRQYLRYMLENHPDSLHYIYRAALRYRGYGGNAQTSFERWRNQLTNKLDLYDKNNGGKK